MNMIDCHSEVHVSVLMWVGMYELLYTFLVQQAAPGCNAIDIAEARNRHAVLLAQDMDGSINSIALHARQIFKSARRWTLQQFDGVGEYE